MTWRKIFSFKLLIGSAAVILIAGAAAAWFFWPGEIVVPVDLKPEERASLEERRQQAYLDIKAHPTGAKYYLEAGFVEKTLGNISAAIRVYKKGIEEISDYYLFYQNLGSVYEDIGRYNDAEAMFRLAIEKKPIEELNYTKLIDLYYAHFAGPVDKLNEIFKTGIDETRGVELMKRYARFLEDQGQIRDAWIYWEEVVSLAPGNQAAQEEAVRLKGILETQNKQ